MLWEILAAAPPYVVLVWLIAYTFRHMERAAERQNKLLRELTTITTEASREVSEHLKENTAALIEFNLRNSGGLPKNLSDLIGGDHAG